VETCPECGGPMERCLTPEAAMEQCKTCEVPVEQCRTCQSGQMRFAKFSYKAVLEAANKGFASPFYLTTKDTEGTVWMLHVDYQEDPEARFESTTLRAYPFGGALTLPIALTLKDAHGRTMRRSLT
jgi:hypothetical protein